jgi:hypothetical protein
MYCEGFLVGRGVIHRRPFAQMASLLSMLQRKPNTVESDMAGMLELYHGNC